MLGVPGCSPRLFRLSPRGFTTLKRARIDAAEAPVPRKVGLSERQWHQQMQGTETNHWRSIDSVQAQIEKAATTGQGWLKGIDRALRQLRPQAARFNTSAHRDESGSPRLERSRCWNSSAQSSNGGGTENRDIQNSSNSLRRE